MVANAFEVRHHCYTKTVQMRTEDDNDDDTVMLKIVIIMMTEQWYNDDDDGIVVITPMMKIDLHCSTLHQVCPHCALIRPSSHYSSLSQWVWRWKKRWKVPALSSLLFSTSVPPPPKQEKKQKSISSIGPCPMAGFLALFWCSTHTHTQTSLTPL